MRSAEDQTGPTTRTTVTKKIRTEYMKKFRDPKWETFSKCYEDSVKYRLSRRAMEHSHKPWFWEGWERGSESGGWSTPRLTRNKIAPLSLPPAPPPPAETKRRSSPSPGSKPPHEERRTGDAVVDAAPTAAAATVNGVSVSEDTETDGGPVDSSSSDGEPVKPAPKRRPRRRDPRPEPGHRDASHDDKPVAAAVPAVRKTPRAKSQPPISTKENRRPSSRLDWSERRETRTPASSSTSDACLQTGGESEKRLSQAERRRSRSADLEKTRRLTVADDRWTTEYMRCFSARLR